VHKLSEKIENKIKMPKKVDNLVDSVEKYTSYVAMVDFL
jgi:hypothetical protein